MKKLFLVCVCFCFYMGISRAQEIEPGESAKGFVNSKSTSVDYCTGTFSYKIPLFELNSGNYKIPVTLSYTAAGVKATDQPGVCGYGWNLICGGVVTRTLRGGVIDEAYSTGYTNSSIGVVNDSVLKLVNLHRKDGESDIFTAVFNGQRVSFILAPMGNQQKVRAIPLEKTNVKIEDNTMGEIQEWRITDENGIKYIFGETERTKDVAVEAGVSTNSVLNSSYISSWYLTEIVYPDAESVYFRYTDQVVYSSGELESGISTTYWQRGVMGYEYGNPIQEYAFDLEPYRRDIDLSILLAQQHAAMARFSVQSQNKIREDLYWADGLMNGVNGSYLSGVQSGLLVGSGGFYAFLDKCMGIVSDVGRLTQGSGEVIRVLSELYNSIPQQSEVNLDFLRSDISNLKKSYKQSMTTKTPITYRRTDNTKTYKVYSKFLKEVVAPGKVLSFEYKFQYPGVGLKNVNLFNYLRDTIGMANLEILSSVLKKIVFRGEGEASARMQEFTYYRERDYLEGTDLWGFYNGTTCGNGLKIGGARYSFIYVPNIYPFQMEAELGEFDDSSCDETHLKRYSLKNIKTSAGAEIDIDYEKNWLYYRENVDYSGLRVKSLFMKDGYGGIDSVLYHYKREDGRSTGNLVATGLSNGHTLVYDSYIEAGMLTRPFRDEVLTGELQDHGIAILNKGNTGIMYDYVREEHVGSGSTAYYFYVPLQNQAGPIVLPEEYPYWLYALPLGQVDYDKRGNRVRMVKNKYYASLSSSVKNGNLPDFIQVNQVPFPYAQKILQVKAYGFYMNQERISLEYRFKPNINLYQDGLEMANINPYQDLYLPNMAPRMNIKLPEQVYDLYYGGKVVLSERREYVFDSKNGINGNGPNYGDLYGALPANGFVLNKTTYHYGSNHCYPVRVVTERSDDDVLDEYTRRVADIGTGSAMQPEIAEMKMNNVLVPVVLQQTYVTRGNRTVLGAESVTEFTSDTLDGKRFYLPGRNYSLLVDKPKSASLPGIEMVQRVFIGNKDKDYSCVRTIYKNIAHAARAVELKTPRQDVGYVYDSGNGELVLSTGNVAMTAVDAVDRYRVISLTNEQLMAVSKDNNMELYLNGRFKSLEEYLDYFTTKMDEFGRLESVSQHPFIRGEAYRGMLEFVRLLRAKAPYSQILKPRTVVLESQPNLEDQYREFMTSLAGVSNALKMECWEMVADIFHAMQACTEEAYKCLDMKGNPDVAGLNLSKELKIKVGNYRKFNCALVTRRNSGSSFTISYQVTYKDGTSRNASQTLSGISGKWQVAALKIDLSTDARQAEIIGLTVNVPNDGSIASEEVYGTALQVLVPEGVDFEAVSRDSKGRAFCKLNALLQMERYEYDGFNRVIKVFDRVGNLLQEYKYHEKSVVNQ